MSSCCFSLLLFLRKYAWTEFIIAIGELRDPPFGSSHFFANFQTICQSMAGLTAFQKVSLEDDVRSTEVVMTDEYGSVSSTKDSSRTTSSTIKPKCDVQWSGISFTVGKHLILDNCWGTVSLIRFTHFCLNFFCQIVLDLISRRHTVKCAQYWDQVALERPLCWIFYLVVLFQTMLAMWRE